VAKPDTKKQSFDARGPKIMTEKIEEACAMESMLDTVKPNNIRAKKTIPRKKNKKKAAAKRLPLPHENLPTYVVGVGASAGGLEALQLLFGEMALDTGMAFIVLQHLSPDYKSMMADIMAKNTGLRILVAKDQMPIEANTLYLLPPNREMITANGRLFLTERQSDEALNLPINTFLQSLADSYQDKSIAIILSGMGSDGSQGVVRVHDNGGLVVVQTPSSCQFDPMPVNAIATNKVDLTLLPKEMPEALVKYMQHVDSVERGFTASKADLDEGCFPEILLLIDTRYGLDFSHYKPATIARRIQRRLALQKCTLKEYVELLQNNSDELDTLYHDLLIGVTQFFRDKAAFQSLRPEITSLFRSFEAEEEIRVWVVACATGQEAYSVAMLMHDIRQQTGSNINIKIFATDIHNKSIDYAAAGVYSAEELKDVNKDYLERYFKKIRSGKYKICPAIRHSIVFAQHNILQEPPFTKVHLLTCRNLLIYFNQNAQQRALGLFTFALKNKGILFLGSSETLGHHEADFRCIDQKNKIFQKKRNTKTPSKIATDKTSGRNMAFAIAPKALGANTVDVMASVKSKRAREILLQRHVPPSVLCDESGNVLHVFGTVGEFLSLDMGSASLNLRSLVGSQAKVAITQMIMHVGKKHEPITVHNVLGFVKHEKVDIEMYPLSDIPGDIGYLLVSFTPSETPAKLPAKTKIRAKTTTIESVDLDSADLVKAHELERELQLAKEGLQSAAEELEASNEELQATNEELIASNEELQATNEELQSVNEELVSVNTEFKIKEHARAEAEADERSIVENSGIGIVFLDDQLNIRKFSLPAAKLFQLSDENIGLPFVAIASSMVKQILASLHQVFNEGGLVEKEMHTPDGSVFRIQIHQLQALGGDEENGDRPRGIIITSTNISKIYSVQKQFARNEIRLQAMLDNLSDGYVEWTYGETAVYLSTENLNRLGYSEDDRLDWQSLLGTDCEDVLAKFDDAIATDRKFEAILSLHRPDGERYWVLCKGHFTQQKQGEKKVERFFGLFVDMQKFKSQEQTLQSQLDELWRSNEILEEFAHIVSHDLKAPIRYCGHSLSFLSEAFANKDEKAVQCEIDNMGKYLNSLKSLIDDVIRFSRFSSEKKNVTSVNLQEVIDEALKLLAHSILEKKATVKYNNLPSIPGDAGMMVHLFQNLISNGCKYNDNAKPKIEISHKQVKDLSVIRVKDNGIGFDVKHAKNIFKPFKRLVTKDQYEGSGIGLAICKILVDQHFGEISVESTPGKGSTFIITLPLSSSALGRPIPGGPNNV